jgi:2-amino-4-hydroxy-6-hydroxymethyldihydropteridine pyrophosphokinase
MNTAFILTGGNLGNRLDNLNTAKLFIQQHCGKVVATSSVYQTAAWGMQQQPDFYNQVLQINTLLSAHQLLKELLGIEAQMGRVRNEKYGPRTIDLDILLFNDEVVDDENLKIPHPYLPQRKFALIPLNEIAQNFVHPVEKKSIHRLLLDCRDTLNVNKISA